MGDLIETISNIFGHTLVQLGQKNVTLWTVIYLIILLYIVFWASGKVRHILTDRVLVKTKLQHGARQTIGTIARYIVIVIGLLIALQTVGIDLTTLNVLAGAIGIGLGFGLQNVANNFISGFIILFERPIKVGDRIVVDNVVGQVIDIGMRSTTVVTGDNISVIVPNSKFISENVTNWSFTDGIVRFGIPVGVAYGTDARRVEQILLDVARDNPDVMEDPDPKVRFTEFGSNSLRFELSVWADTENVVKPQLVSDLNMAIYDQFAVNNIEIPYPQLDIHMKQ